MTESNPSYYLLRPLRTEAQAQADIDARTRRDSYWRFRWSRKRNGGSLGALLIGTAVLSTTARGAMTRED